MSSGSAQETSGDQRTAAESPTDQTQENKPQGDQTEQNRHEQERGSQQNRLTGRYQQGGGDGRYEESDGDDEDRDPTYEVSDSDDEDRDQSYDTRKFPKWFLCVSKRKSKSKKESKKSKKENKKAGKNISKKKVKNKDTQCLSLDQDQLNDSNINEGSNHEIQIKQRVPGEIRAALLNVHSMNNKTSRISQLIRGNNLDVFLTTETWLQQRSADRVLREASPPNFSFYYHVREDGRGGGVAIQFSNELQGRQIYFSFITTFEYVATVLQHDGWNQPVPTINVYYPPGYKQQQFRVFLNEFQRLLDEVFSVYNSIIVTGDFNIWVDRTRRSFTDEFDHLLLINNLVQHVHEPTHERGHTLDLVITRNVAVPALVVRNDNISDHYTVYFNVRPESTRDELARQPRQHEE